MPPRAAGSGEKDTPGKGVMIMSEKKDCGCGCVPPGKTQKGGKKSKPREKEPK